MKDDFNYKQEYYIRDYLIIQNCGKLEGMEYNGITILKRKENVYAEEYEEVFHAGIHDNIDILTIDELEKHLKFYEELGRNLPDIIADEEDEDNDDI